jgi:hypothetical protein
VAANLYRRHAEIHVQHTASQPCKLITQSLVLTVTLTVEQTLHGCRVAATACFSYEASWP